ncbi:MAG: cytochrome c3 family protein, partial [Gemmatimonadales bacterium]
MFSSKRGTDFSDRLLRPARLAWAALGVALLAIAGPIAAQDQDLNPHGTLAVPCATCHSADGWTPAVIRKSFDHRSLGFGLEDAHGAVSCSGCHQSLQFDRVERTCAGCHQDVHRGELGQDCAQCHTTRAFTDRAPQARLHAFTNFPLEGAHQGVDCRACHNPAGNGTLAFRATPTECASCHQGDFDRTTTPPHASAGFPGNCTMCHGSVTFRGARFDHQTTKFPLTGAHQATACLSCHGDNLYIDKPSACMACHQAEHARTERPPHLAAGFSNDCEACHTTTAWAGAPFDHRTTRFPLAGAHQATTCDQCHGDGTYVGKSTTCVSCHQTDFTETTTPPHQPAGFSTVCTDCHTEVTWTGARFDHGTTQFPLTGGHLATSCDQCHGDGVYGAKPTTCVSCHQSDFAGTTTPPHQPAGFSTDCTSCHTTVTWNTALFDHATTQFPLTGAHLAATCAQCHQDGVYVGKPTTCVSCHQTEFAGTTTPPHQSSGFSTDCAACHTSITWSGAQFDHQQSQFPLTGAHLATTCEQCHGDGVYAGKPTTCVSCHQTSYTQTTDPPHQPAGFQTDCAACHTTITWTGGSFDHQATQFPLTGAHLTTTCAQCHQDGVYDGKPTTCVSCHQTSYTQTTNRTWPRNRRRRWCRAN